MKFMAQMRHGKKVLNNGFGQFRGLVERKSNDHLREFIKASKWFPSSQIFNVCGFRNPITIYSELFCTVKFRYKKFWGGHLL